MLPKPQSRLEVLLNKIATNTMNDLPIPQSRLELLVSSLITNDIDSLPSPQSRSEAILHCILLDTECNISPQSRVELFLKSIITLDIEGLPTPMSRIEWYLDYIVRNGCLEKYEYYPFNIWSYLNVKNTPKAKMKFKGAKGNTLVNKLNPIGSITESETNFSAYTNTVLELGSYTIVNNSSKKIYFNVNDAVSGVYLSTVTLESNEKTKLLKYDKKVKIINFGGGKEFGWSGNNKEDLGKQVLLEGDHTQNPPPYFENMKSFGDGANKIEVLSDNNLQGELNQSSKATLMYRNSSNELVPIPILRGKLENGKFLWGDEILLHEDGQLYYHKRTYFKKFTDGLSWYDDYNAQLGENLISFAYDADTNIKVGTRICSDKYNEITSSTALEGLFPSGSKNGIRIKINKSKCTDLKSLDTYIRNNNFSVVVELTKEEVYPCELSEQLYSYDGETNIFINGGAVVGETVIEVGTKLGPIVATLKQETKIVTDGLKGVLAGDMQELAYQLYPDDFNTTGDTEKKIKK